MTTTQKITRLQFSGLLHFLATQMERPDGEGFHNPTFVYSGKLDEPSNNRFKTLTEQAGQNAITMMWERRLKRGIRQITFPMFLPMWCDR
jgi:hypothetical protein